MNTLLSNLIPRAKKINISDLISLKLPPIYQLFYNTYEIDSNKTYGVFCQKVQLNGNVDGLGGFYWKMNDAYNNLCWDPFFSINEIIETKAIGTIDDIIEESQLELLYIGRLSSYYPICLGLESENCDKIFFPGDNIYENGLIKLADNIFEFCTKFTFTIDDTKALNLSNLYKNRNEDFWRIKPPEFRNARPFELLDKDSLDKRYIELKKSGAGLLEIEYEYKVRGIELPKKFLFW